MSSGWDDWGDAGSAQNQESKQDSDKPTHSGGGGQARDSWNDAKPGDSWGDGKPGDSWDDGKPGDSWGDETNNKDNNSKNQSEDRGNRKNRTERREWGDNGSNSRNNRSDKPPGDGNDDDEKEKKVPYKPQEIDIEEEAKLQSNGVGENFKRYKDQSVTCFPSDAVKPISNFEDVIESNLLLDNITYLKYSEMTPIQKWAMPAIKDGHDIIGCAQTGSGKTAAFLLPILQNILKLDLNQHNPNDDCQNPYCLILSPTRELARQIYTHAKMLSRDSLVKSCVVYGQVSTAHLKYQLSNGCHILVATLGRLKDFVERRWIAFKNIKYLVLDEGDRLIDDSFRGDILSIIQHETMPPKSERQTLFFSATFKKEIQANARDFLNDSFVFLAVGKIGASNEDIKQEFIKVPREKKKAVIIEILNSIPETDKAIIFAQTKATADFLASYLSGKGLLSASIHGDRHQSQREQALAVFRTGERRLLVSSPVGNRGLDLPKVAIVINYDLPDNIDEYVHRIGRTGRAGHTGRAMSFFDPNRDREILPDLLKNLKDAKQTIPEWLEESEEPAYGGGGEDNGWSRDAPKQVQSNTGASSMSDGWNNSAPTPAAKDDWNDIPSATSQEKSTNRSERPTDSRSSAQKRPADDDDWGKPVKKVDNSSGIEPQFEESW